MRAPTSSDHHSEVVTISGTAAPQHARHQQPPTLVTHGRLLCCSIIVFFAIVFFATGFLVIHGGELWTGMLIIMPGVVCVGCAVCLCVRVLCGTSGDPAPTQIYTVSNNHHHTTCIESPPSYDAVITDPKYLHPPSYESLMVTDVGAPIEILRSPASAADVGYNSERMPSNTTSTSQATSPTATCRTVDSEGQILDPRHQQMTGRDQTIGNENEVSNRPARDEPRAAPVTCTSNEVVDGIIREQASTHSSAASTSSEDGTSDTDVHDFLALGAINEGYQSDTGCF